MKTVRHPETKAFRRVWGLAAILFLGGIWPVLGENLKILRGHVPQAAYILAPKTRLAATNQLRLAIGISLRDPAGLENFVAQVSDPASPNFRRYLTREQLTSRFGPTEQDYEAVKNFASASGLAISVSHSNRLVLDVTGPASAIEKAFHVTLWKYRHPAEPRDFFAPSAEPMVDASLPIADVEGLTDFWRPHPRLVKRPRTMMPKIAASGTAPDGSGDLFGDDFRNAYVPGTSLTGAGQSVGLLEFDGYFTNDIYLYASAAGNGRTNIIIEPVLLDGYDGTPSTGPDGNEVEVELDIEMAMAIAPGLSKIVSYEAGSNGEPNDILSAMLDNTNVVNLDCCWGWGGGPTNTTDAILESMVAVGQSFFDASGDGGAYTTGVNSDNGVDNPTLANAPSSNPYMTQVGGTTLKLNSPGASWKSEVVWDFSGGGISSYYKIPAWQTNVNHLVNRGGSTRFRNIPDVAANANNVYEIYNNDDTNDADDVQGTSCAAPLWAGFAALANEESAANGGPNIGFINPALYTIAAGNNYLSCFHDITSGNNTWYGSTKLFYAATNYDLCTGLGAIGGTNLINALASPVPPPAFLPPGRKSNRLVLSWTTVRGQAYQLQYVDEPGSTNWINLGPVTNASGAVASIIDPLTNSQRFYRVILKSQVKSRR